MAIRRSIDSLIQEFAEMRGVSADYAVRLAVSEALQRDRGRGKKAKEDASHARSKEAKEQALHAPSIEAIYARGLAIAGSRGEDKAVGQLCSDLGPPVVIIAICLLGDAFFERYLQSTVLALVSLGLISSYIYWRSLQKIGKSREQMRASLALEIEELSQKLPDQLSFLADPPTGDPYFKLFVLEREGSQ
ncbi:hypothetical protein [Acidicapsa acidisoli]|uniref:hypothetical protein n=1 Tax=Acidicapsa acidisoli TaxID=1615681 RepID=UPI0021DF7C38|nr:hypothetical protein [Acidicapsa acidisoli]